MDIPKVPGCHLEWQMSAQGGSEKSFQGSMSHELTAHLSDFHIFFDSIKWSFNNIQGFRCKFVVSDSFLGPNFLDIWCLMLDDWNKLGRLDWFYEFLCDGLSSFNSNGFFYSYAWFWELLLNNPDFFQGNGTRQNFLLSRMWSLKIFIDRDKCK